jgi:GSH-dependent disulfide-bond oxidoreductase
MIELYTAGTGNGQRAAIALEETGLRYRAHKLDFAKNEHRSPEYLKINPAGAIPAIIDPEGPGGKPITLAQSSAILLYCAEKTGTLIPKDPAARARAMQWLMQAVTDCGPTSSAIFAAMNRVPEKSAANTEFLEQRLLGYLAVADGQLEGKDWVAGELSVADLALYPVFRSRKALVDKAPGLANLKRWGAALAARPTIQRAIAACG